MDHKTYSLPPQRRRRPVRKSFYGCERCKARKIKCDETKPCCARCAEKGLACPGVLKGPKIRWSTKHEIYQAEEVPFAGLYTERQALSPSSDIEILQKQNDAVKRDLPQTKEHEIPISPGDGSGVLTELLQSSQDEREDLADSQASTSMEIQLSNTLCPALFNVESELVRAYFTIVCPIFSTFDSEQNLFRSFVGETWHYSLSIFYALLSMAAAKLARKKPEMRPQARQYQSLALTSLRTDVAGTSVWTTELLFVVLMMGLSTSWHDTADLGIMHLKAMQGAILDENVQLACEPQVLGFFRDALVYWEMVVCSVNDEVSVQGHSTTKLSQPQPDPRFIDKNLSQPRLAQIMPHPWTGVASAPQELFGRVTQHIRHVRPFNSTRGLDRSSFLKSLDSLEEDMWLLELPKLHEIANTGDQNTPAIHHLLLAEAYIFATLYQLYHAFPQRAQQRIRRLREATLDNTLGFRSDSWAEHQARSWSSLILHSSTEEWVSFLGRNVITQLEQIQIESGTVCVHSLLLLVGSGSLAATPELEENGKDMEILRKRVFVLDRLSQLSDSMLSEPVSQVRLAVVEVFRLLDVGVDVFWMDVLHSMGVVTVIG